jgi:UvrB/uvrC motif
MNDSPDLRSILKSWPYDPEHDARIVRGDDGREVLQVRTPLGIEQYEMDGRPDGLRLHGMDSALEYHLHRLNQAKFSGCEADFELTPEECSELFHEGTLFYFRYVQLFQLKDWARTVRDTARNLRAFDFLHRYARREEDQQFLEKWRPYILHVNASAAVMQAMEKGGFDQALKLTQEAIGKIESLAELEDDTFKFERERSVQALRELESQIRKNQPLSGLEQLEHQLRRAIQKQEFERAAHLRDRIRELRQQQTVNKE